MRPWLVLLTALTLVGLRPARGLAASDAGPTGPVECGCCCSHGPDDGPCCCVGEEPEPGDEEQPHDGCACVADPMPAPRDPQGADLLPVRLPATPAPPRVGRFVELWQELEHGEVLPARRGPPRGPPTSGGARCALFSVFRI